MINYIRWFNESAILRIAIMRDANLGSVEFFAYPFAFRTADVHLNICQHIAEFLDAGVAEFILQLLVDVLKIFIIGLKLRIIRLKLRIVGLQFRVVLICLLAIFVISVNAIMCKACHNDESQEKKIFPSSLFLIGIDNSIQEFLWYLYYFVVYNRESLQSFDIFLNKSALFTTSMSVVIIDKI